MSDLPHSQPPPELLKEEVLAALELIDIAVLISRIDGDAIRAVYASRRFAALVGRSLDELMTMDLRTLLPNEIRPRIVELHHQWIGGTAVEQRIALPIRRNSGKTLLIEVGAARVELGGEPALITFSVETTDKAEAADTLRRSEERFRALAEAAPDAIAVIRQGIVTFANAAMQRLRIVEGAAWPAPPLELARAIAAPPVHEMLSIPIRLVCDGQLRHLMLTLATVGFDEGPAIIVFARDETETHALQSRLLSTDRLASLGSLVSGLAHNVNNPLTTVLLNLASLARELPSLMPEGADLERALFKVSEAKTAADRVRQSMRRLRGFSTWRDSPSDIDVRNVLDVVIGMVDYATPPGIELVLDYGPVPKVHAVEAALAQVFLGLLRNALQAFSEPPPQGSRIGIQVSSSDRSVVVVDITDSGKGIAADDVGRVFEPFFSGDPDSGRSGLGLSICRSIVTELGGLIYVSSPHSPTSLRVVLPAAPEPATRAPIPEHTVLVIVDDIDEGGRYRAALEPYVGVRQVAPGAQALEMEADCCALAICDGSVRSPSARELAEELGRKGMAVVVAVAAGTLASPAPPNTIEKPLTGPTIAALLEARPGNP